MPIAPLDDAAEEFHTAHFALRLYSNSRAALFRFAADFIVLPAR
jgi:hypothetical protein